MAVSKPKPGAQAPQLKVKTQHGDWTLAERKPDAFTVIVFYRGFHCPICKTQLEGLNKKLAKFTEKGLEVIAISMDGEERWSKSRDEWDIDDVTLGYGLDEATARAWGLYLSSPITDKEPELFCEPGLFLIKPDGALYAASIQSMPFARPSLDDVLSAVDFVAKNDYPPRGVRD